MTQRSAAPHGVMEGQGSYNKHAQLPATGAALGLPLLERAVQRIPLDSTDLPITIADYGSSQGKNSLLPMHLAIAGLRRRIASTRPISVFHIDQPSNDFNSLFEVLHAAPGRYTTEPHIFPAAIGKSFYDRVLPPNSVHLAWSSYAAVWLSKIPVNIPDHLFCIHSTGAVHAAFERQAAEDWERFLSLRALELRPGGRLVVVLPAVDDQASLGLEPIFDQANLCLRDMVADGVVTPEERSQMTIGVYPRKKAELYQPFAATGTFQQLVAEDFHWSEFPDAAWVDYQRDGDKEALAAKQALFFRSIFVPSLAAALSRAGTLSPQTFADHVEQRLKRRLAEHGASSHSFVQTMVLAKIA